MSPPFRYNENPARDNPMAGSIAATLRDRGLIAAQGAQRVGDLQAEATRAGAAGTAGIVSAIGQTAASIPGVRHQAQVQDQEDAARTLQLDDLKRKAAELKALDAGYLKMMEAGGDRSVLFDSLAKSGQGHMVPQAQKGFLDYDKSYAEVQKLRDEADQKAVVALANMGSVIAESGYDPTALQLAISDQKVKYGNDPARMRQLQQFEQKLHNSPTVETVRSIVDPLIRLDPERRKEAETALEHRNLEKDRAAQRDAQAATLRQTQQRDEVAHEDRQAALQVSKQRAQAALLAAKNGGAASRDDAIAIADAIEQGMQPPDLKSLYRMAGPVKAELQRRGFDLTRASLDWQAVQKLTTTLNGTKVSNMRSAISTASDSLDVIDSLADQWNSARIIKDGKLIPLNRAELKLAQQGVYGQQAQSIATQLEGQITDVVSELGQVYMGGNSPTDHALGLAEKNLKGEWSAQTLKDMTKLARTNLRIRGNSINGLKPISFGSEPEDKPAAADASAPKEGDEMPITEPGYPPGATKTFKGGKWIRTK